jgi:hypothetical protein
MADFTVIPTKTTEVGDGAGNHYLILEIKHTTGHETLIPVPDGACSAAQLPSTNSAAVIALEAGSDVAASNPGSNAMRVQNAVTAASGLGFDWQENDGVKQVIIDNTVATGTYTIVVRCAGGSAAGIGSTGAAGL